MPSEPRVPTEPTLEDLSAYLDHELNDDATARVAEHVAGCADCRTRLDALRETAFAIRALPMETPTRTFTIPAKPRVSSNWAPVAGWIGGVAAAMLIIVVGVTHLPLHPAGMATSNSPVSGGLGQGAAAPYAAGAPYHQVAPLGQSAQNDSTLRAFSSNSKTVAGAQGSSSSLTISTDGASYSAAGVITIHVTTKGLSAAEASSVRIFLMRESGQGGYLVRLMPPSTAPTFPFDYQAAYSIHEMQLPAPVAGNYTLQVTIDTSDRSGLVAWLPLTITP
ncbi:MAG TPA: zf-HC2 domain-containing protein [Candidatus Dormibacteraeota bacterium]